VLLDNGHPVISHGFERLPSVALPVEDADAVHVRDLALLQRDLALEAEELLAHGDVSDPVDQPASIYTLLHELQVYQAELEIQNEELRRTERERAKLQHKYEDLYQHAPCGYVTLNNIGQLSRNNLKAAELLKLKDNDILVKSFQDYIRSGWQDHFNTTKLQAARTNRPQSCQLPLMPAGDKERWVQAELSADLNDDGTVLQWRLILVDITEKKATEISLEEKETMLREIHHRVKNNMQLISSLISIQARELPQSEARSALEEVKQRVHAMTLVHEMLYHLENFARIRFDKYINELVTRLTRAYQRDVNIRLEEDLEPLRIPVHQALPAGLIINELFCNTLLHAFPNRREGSVQLSMHCGEDRVVRLEINDDGIGLPEGFDWQNQKKLGLQLVPLLTKQLGGEIEGLSSKKGASFTLTFPLDSSTDKDPK
jgi:two-component sensor histidine kinase